MDRLEVPLKDYELIPMASTSQIRCLDGRGELPLYGSGSFFKTSSTLNRFDQAMAAFVDAFSQLQVESVTNRLNCACLSTSRDASL
jgi:hypothetical protein